MKQFLRMEDVITKTGISRSSIYSYIKKGTFPSQVKLGPRAIGWPIDDIDAWIDQQIEISKNIRNDSRPTPAAH